ncbi:U32 family peptidase [Chitinispirillales bacterium ANBcel5]|uniref:U32 family peptidase n=1 Tax=Cellulosispirillum alkaliphilum TaxID=3039283 RepID=UPI002A511E69|nr:U32 family peptidase [Chitinispirillales bacterium ANBcel5]
MDLSVAYSFQPNLLKKLAAYPSVKEVYAKLDTDLIGGGRSGYTLKKVNKKTLIKSIEEAKKLKLRFNYLLNAATLDGLEQTRQGQKKIHRFLDFLTECNVDTVTVSVPYLLETIKKFHPHFRTKVGVFAKVDTAASAKQWQEMGADCICVSAISCNRDFDRLISIRDATTCELQLIVNACCVPSCARELTHMHILTKSSRTNDSLGGFCLDHCFLSCSSDRLKNPIHLIRSVWIRPEDITIYESLGYNSFKIVERSSPAELILSRVKAYNNRYFEGNLFELIAPVALIKKQQGVNLADRLKTLRIFMLPRRVKFSTIMAFKRYAESVIPHQFDKIHAPIYINNRNLDGYLEQLKQKGCSSTDCKKCSFCETTAANTVSFNNDLKLRALSYYASLRDSLYSTEQWL